MAVSLSLDKETAAKLKEKYLQYQYDDEYDDSFDENIKYGITSSDTDDDLRSSIEIPNPEEESTTQEQETVHKYHQKHEVNERNTNQKPKIMEPSRVHLSKRERETQQARFDRQQQNETQTQQTSNNNNNTNQKPGIGRGTNSSTKSHNQKDRSLKKRGGMLQ
jgi:hypothetical protein